MELPDFDTLKRWALIEPERLDELLHLQIEALIAQTGPERRRALRGLQFRIDCQRRLSRHPLDSCIRIASMMHDAFSVMHGQLTGLDHAPELTSAADETRNNNVIQLADYRPGK